MKKIFIIFLFTTFGFTLTFAEDNKKITVEEIEDIFGFEKEKKKKDNETPENYFNRIRDIYYLEKITKEEKKKKRNKEIEDRAKRHGGGIRDNETKELFIERIERESKETRKKRIQLKGIAKCMYNIADRAWGGMDKAKQCNAKVIRAVLTSSEKSKKKEAR